MSDHPTEALKNAPRPTQRHDGLSCCVCGTPADSHLDTHICADCAAVTWPAGATAITPHMAERVVYRHPCDCATASRPPGPGEHAEHRFDVDGQEFPWYLHEEGPRFTQVDENLYMIHVRIFTGLVGGRFGAFVHDYPKPPIIAGITFPWLIDEYGITYRCSRTEAPTVELSFFARYVDADFQIGTDRAAYL